MQRIKESVAEEPRRLSYVKSKIEDETGKSSSKLTLTNIQTGIPHHNQLADLVKGAVNIDQ